jgi:hypothetical protein
MNTQPPPTRRRRMRSAIQSILPARTDQPAAAALVYPTRLVSANRLDLLTDLVTVGGDALAGSSFTLSGFYNRSGMGTPSAAIF